MNAINLIDGSSVISRFSMLRRSAHPFHWKNAGNYTYVVWNRYFEGGRRFRVLLKRFDVAWQGSEEYARQQEHLIDSLGKEIGNRDKASLVIGIRAQLEEEFGSIAPLYSLLALMKEVGNKPRGCCPVAFDFIPLEESGLLFYIRSYEELTVWGYQYGESGQVDQTGVWQEMATYSLDTVPLTLSSFTWLTTDALLPSGKHHRYQSIPDSALFQGHFKAIRQGGETFIFNTTTGYLYHLGPEDIARVGQVSLKNYPRWLFGKPLFIEDRDAGELVFFAEAERLDGARAFPKVVLAKNRRALNERYPGLVGK